MHAILYAHARCSVLLLFCSECLMFRDAGNKPQPSVVAGDASTGGQKRGKQKTEKGRDENRIQNDASLQSGMFNPSLSVLCPQAQDSEHLDLQVVVFYFH